jgi:HEAT repeat protein
MRLLALLSFLAAAALAADPPSLQDPAHFERLVREGDVEALLRATDRSSPPAERRLACLGLGRVGGDRARDRLLELLGERTGDATADGWIRLYAAHGLARLGDPGTAMDLVLAISTANPDDFLAARAAMDRDDEYFTIDAQLCDALLGMGVWNAEESLVEQLRRRHRVRVAIDALEVLRRRTGLALPFRYNGSFAAREADAAAWEKALRETRASRVRARPFDASNPRFQARCREVAAWLGGARINYRLIAQRSLGILGPPAVPFLLELLSGENPVAQRQAAFVLGRIGERGAGPALIKALEVRDDDARAEAIDALRRLGYHEAHDAVRARLGDPDPEVRAAAATYLGSLRRTEDAATLRAAGERETIAGTRTAILCARLRCGDTGALPDLVRVFVEGEPLDRRSALAAIEEHFGSPLGLDPDADREVRAAKAEEILSK